MHADLEFSFLPGGLNCFHYLVAFFILLRLFFPLKSILSHKTYILTQISFGFYLPGISFIFRFAYSQPFNALYFSCVS